MSDVILNTEYGAVKKLCGKELNAEQKAQMEQQIKDFNLMDAAVGEDGEDIFRNAVKQFKPKEKNLVN